MFKFFRHVFFCAAVAITPTLYAQTSVEINPVTAVYSQADGRDLKAYVFSPPAKSGERVPAVLLFHGGGWAVGDATWSFAQARRLVQLGMVAIAVDYRLADASHTPADALLDTCNAFRWARQNAQVLNIDAKRVAGFGESAGGQLLGMAATRGCGQSARQAGPDALALWSPALDVAHDSWFTQQMKSADGAAANSPLLQLQARIVPTVIITGDSDVITPPAGIRQFCDKARSLGGRCDLTVYPGVGHLLTRNVKDQISSYDPDPALVESGLREIESFFRQLWFKK